MPLEWSDNLTADKKAWFNHDYDQNGIVSLEEQAKGLIAYSQMTSTMDKTAYGVARQIRMGVEYIF